MFTAKPWRRQQRGLRYTPARTTPTGTAINILNLEFFAAYSLSRELNDSIRIKNNLDRTSGLAPSDDVPHPFTAMLNLELQLAIYISELHGEFER